MNNPKFEIFIGKDQQYYFRLIARNGEIILASEGYTALHNCQKGILSVKENAAEKNFDQRTAKNEQHYFVLKAQNGEIIGKSETYTTKAACENGIAAVIKIASTASVEDITQ